MIKHFFRLIGYSTKHALGLLFFLHLSWFAYAQLTHVEMSSVGVNFRNYTNQTITLFFWDADKPLTKVTPEFFVSGPYGATSGQCCVNLPRKWHDGIKIKVRYAFGEENREALYDSIYLEKKTR